MLRHRSVLLCAAALLASSCNSGRAISTSSSTTTTSSVSSTAPSGPVCPSDNAVISAATPKVHLQAPGSVSVVEVIAGQALPCSSVVRIDESGAANFTFGTTAACQFRQDVKSKQAIAVAREPDGTLLRIQEGLVYCTTKGGRRIQLCGSGDIQLNGDVNQVKAACNPDPVFQVGLIQGSAVVRDLAGAISEIGGGDSLTYDFGAASSGVGPAEFGSRDMAIFRLQAERLKIPFQPSVTTSTSTSTSTSTTTTTIVIP